MAAQLLGSVVVQSGAKVGDPDIEGGGSQPRSAKADPGEDGTLDRSHMLVQGQHMVGSSGCHGRATGHGLGPGVIGARKAPPGCYQSGSGNFVGVGTTEAGPKEHGIEPVQGVATSRCVFDCSLAPLGGQDDHAALFKGISAGIADDMRTSAQDQRGTGTVAVRSDEVSRGVAGRGGTPLERVVGQDDRNGGGEVGTDQNNDTVIERTGREQRVSRVERG